MAVGFRAATNTGNAAFTSTVAPAVPAGAAADDVVVVFLGVWTSGGAVTVTPPSGFTSAGTWQSGDGGARNSVWWKRLTGSDSGSYSFGLSAANWSTGQAVCLTGVTTSGDPVGSQFVSATGTFGSITSVALTVGAGDGLVWMVYNDSNGAHTPATGFTEVADVDSGSTAYLLQGSAGTVTASGGSISSSSSASVAMVALTAAGGGGGSVATPGPIVAPRMAAHRAVW